MMNLIKPPSPEYKGTSQAPKNGGGLLSQLLCYLFGGGSPAYKGQGQSTPRRCGSVIFPDTPVYKEPTVADDTSAQEPEPCRGEGDEPEVPIELDSANAHQGPVGAMGPITIVVR